MTNQNLKLLEDKPCKLREATRVVGSATCAKGRTPIMGVLFLSSSSGTEIVLVARQKLHRLGHNSFEDLARGDFLNQCCGSSTSVVFFFIRLDSSRRDKRTLLDRSVAVTRRWQERSEPLFRWAFEGCHTTRDTPSLIGKGAFNIERMDAGYLAPFPKSGSYCWWSVALPERKSGLS
jgi:hypothetical protein